MPNARRITFSGEHLQLAQINRYYSDVEASVRTYFSVRNARLTERFVGYTPQELEREMASVLEEHARSTSMSILAAFNRFMSYRDLPPGPLPTRKILS